MWSALSCPKFLYISAHNLSAFTTAIISISFEVQQFQLDPSQNLELQIKMKVCMPFNFSVKCHYLQLENSSLYS